MYECGFYSIEKDLDGPSCLNRGCSKKTIVLFVVTHPMLNTEDFFFMNLYTYAYGHIDVHARL